MAGAKGSWCPPKGKDGVEGSFWLKTLRDGIAIWLAASSSDLVCDFADPRRFVAVGRHEVRVVFDGGPFQALSLAVKRDKRFLPEPDLSAIAGHFECCLSGLVILLGSWLGFEAPVDRSELGAIGPP